VNDHGTKDLCTTASPALALGQDDFYFGPTFIKAKPGDTKGSGGNGYSHQPAKGTTAVRP